VSRTAERQVSFADWELKRQGLRLEPLLQPISDFLDDQKDMIDQVRCDLIRDLKNAETGRSGMTPQQILRSLVLMRIRNWDKSSNQEEQSSSHSQTFPVRTRTNRTSRSSRLDRAAGALRMPAQAESIGPTASPFWEIANRTTGGMISNSIDTPRRSAPIFGGIELHGASHNKR
jgi:hypothetical protein